MTRLAAVAVALALSAAPAFAGGPSDEEALAWAKKVEETIQARDPSFLDQTFDFEAMGERAFAGLSVTNKSKGDFVSGMKKKGMSFGKTIVSGLGTKGTWKFVRMLKRGDDKVAIFRATMEKGDWTYEELTLAASGGSTCFIDLVNHGTAFCFSRFVRELALSIAISEDKDLFERLKGEEAEMARHMTDLAAITKLNREQKWRETIDACKKLPEALQTSRTVLLIELVAAKKLGADEYRAALDICQKHLGKDPAFAVLSFGRALLDKDWTQALAAIDVLDKAVGGDPFMDYQRCEIHYAAGALDKAKEAGLRAVEKEPGLEPAQWALITIALKTKDWPGTVAGLGRLEKQGVKLKDLTKVPLFSEFVKTDEYAAWAKEHAEKKSGDPEPPPDK